MLTEVTLNAEMEDEVLDRRCEVTKPGIDL
jgi:hypothetical protein